MIERARKGAIKRSLEFSITEADISPLPIRCPVFPDLVLDYHSTGHSTPDNAASLDRFDSAKGYIPGNVRVISYRANSIKRDATVEEIKRLYAYMVGYLPRLPKHRPSKAQIILFPDPKPPKPCRVCGATDRNASGKCRPCHVRATRKFKDRASRIGQQFRVRANIQQSDRESTGFRLLFQFPDSSIPRFCYALATNQLIIGNSKSHRQIL
jgi:hypothetical protein